MRAGLPAFPLSGLRDDLAALGAVVAARQLRFDRDGDRLLVDLDGGDAPEAAAALNRAALHAGVELVDVHIERPTLESTYLDRLQETA
ncbi:MAG: transporter related protein [Frankiales bacterium]|jgi:hypothetical protein|nr:transporter related protein [Frankiales bacterium]